MPADPINRVTTLTFDIFGTVLDLTGGIVPVLRDFVDRKGLKLDPHELWRYWRTRQRLEQHQDTILMLGHSGYLEVARRALAFTLRAHHIEFEVSETHNLIGVFERLRPFEDARLGLKRLATKYELVALSNGNQALLDKLCDESVGAPFKARISVDRFGRFKPHPSIYRGAAAALGAEPGELMMVAAHSFDVHGARACGYRGAYVNRYRLPYEDSPLVPDWTGPEFNALCDRLGV